MIRLGGEDGLRLSNLPAQSGAPPAKSLSHFRKETTYASAVVGTKQT